MDGAAAFLIDAPDPSPVPVLIAVPHAGRTYPPTLIHRLRNPGYATLRLEDRLVDRLAHCVAEQTGASLLVAHAPRAMIDLNRAADDIDWGMFADHPAHDGLASASPVPGQRARGGLGLIPRRLPGMGDLWKSAHDHGELEARIAGVHAPYHRALEGTLASLRNRWGAALLIDLHSMPPLPQRGALPAPEFVVGDRFGATCSGALVASVFASLGQAGKVAAHNRPYAGGYVLERHAAPRRNVHAFQLEVDRSSYLDARLAELGNGFPAMVGILTDLVRRLAAEVAELGRTAGGGRWAEAAE